MGNYGSLFGWLIMAGFTLTLLNYPVKVIYRKWVADLDKSSTFKKTYMKVQQVIVKYHRFYGLFATIMLITHLVIQVQYRWVSRTGLLAASLLILNVLLGVYGHYYKKKKRSAWFYVHRTVAVLALAAIILHLITQ